MLTDDEHKLIHDIGQLACRFSKLGKAGAAEAGKKQYDGDGMEITFHIHALQNWVMSNAAARCHPDKYRLFGASNAKEITPGWVAEIEKGT